MSHDWLTVEMVGELQECIEDGRDIDSLVSSLLGASLPGFVEYRCLRRVKKDLVPPLPIAITSSTIGKAFGALRPSVSLQTARTVSSQLRRIDSLPAEFYLINTQVDLGDENWKAFTIRFARSAQGVGLDRLIAGGLRGALLEMAENAVLHAQTDSPILVGYRVLDGFAQFCVADVGIGVLSSLQSCPDYSHLRYDNAAIKEALRDGVSCMGRNRGGMGFREIFKALSAQWGQLRFRSGQGCLMMDGTDLDCDHFTEDFVTQLPGFQVTVSCRTGSSSPAEPLF
jgi:anti-sigma regulatory factor (Ser/Thr protein kinase)